MLKYQESRLENGMLVVTENDPNAHAISIGIGIKVGVVDEPLSLNGISHFIEHMVFKGTKSFDAFSLSNKIESLGGDINAYTAREMTCFHVTLLQQDYRIGLRVLSELVQSARFPHKDIEKEKAVVLQEIAMTNDNPEDCIFDRFYEDFYKKQSLGYPILGNPQTLIPMKKKDLAAYYNIFYRPENMVVSACGKVNHKDFVREVKKLFPKKGSLHLLPSRSEKIEAKPFVKKWSKRSEQVHILIGCPLSSLSDGIFYEASILNTYLAGGGMTSRLYQELREKRGLCYSVFSMFMPLETSGSLCIYTATDAKHALSAVANIIKELKRIKKKGLSAKEIAAFKKQLTGNVVLNADDIESRMNSLLLDALIGRKYRPMNQIIKGIEKVTKSRLDRYIESYMDLSKTSLYAIGRIKTNDWLKIRDLVKSEWIA